MSAPIFIGTTGIAGWNVLKRVEGKLIETVGKGAQVKTDTSYFTGNIGKIDTSEELVSDFRMLNYFLKANGLEGDVNNKAFIRKVIDSDLSDPASLANRLSDKRYARLARSFNNLTSANATVANSEVSKSSTLYVERDLERRIGATDNNLRMALSARRELQELGQRVTSEKAFWYEILGNVPLRTVFEGALGLPPAYRKLDIDRQFDAFTAAAESRLGTRKIADITSGEKIEFIAKTFLARSVAEIEGAGRSPYQTALQIIRVRAG